MLRHPHWATNAVLQSASENNPPLRPGATGEAVALLQAALMRLGIMAQASATTFFGDQTARAIVEVERRHQLPRDRGIAGREVLAAIDQEMLERDRPSPAAAPPDVRTSADYIDNVAFAISTEPFTRLYRIFYKRRDGIRDFTRLAPDAIDASPVGTPGFVQQVFPNVDAMGEGIARANVRHRNEQGAPAGRIYGFYRFSNGLIVPSAFSRDSTPRIMLGIQAKDFHSRSVASGMRDLLLNFALPIPAGRLAASAVRGVNFLISEGRVVAQSPTAVNTNPILVVDSAAETQRLAAVEVAQEIRLSRQEYDAALARVFPSDFADAISRIVDDIGQQAAQRAINDPRFIQAVRNGDITLAGTLFHSAAATTARNVPAGSLPRGWSLTAEESIRTASGRGGSRLDILFRGPAGERIEIDWKTTGLSALSSGALRQMERHAGQIATIIRGQLVRQESRSWVDYVRASLRTRNLPWP